ncbi:hypothetical protein NDU88_006241 [Pleurodeles waltl]|uniref:Uncharacterized protein n=1 Tax=Pleurodeles waltl TaxID=8319 RepID=A0AAV7QN07_PLEWA|nr:hypothetical protein NDU88_006241 [Pleurodeles waltl]
MAENARNKATKVDLQIAFRANDEVQRLVVIPEEYNTEEEGIHLYDKEEEDPGIGHELQVEHNSLLGELPHKRAGSSVFALGLSLEELEDRKVEKEFRLQLAKMKLESDERKAEAVKVVF